MRGNLPLNTSSHSEPLTAQFSKFLSPSLPMRTGFLYNQHICSSINLMNPALLNISAPIAQETGQPEKCSTANNSNLFPKSNSFKGPIKVGRPSMEKATDRCLAVQSALFYWICFLERVTICHEQRYIWAHLWPPKSAAWKENRIESSQSIDNQETAVL